MSSPRSPHALVAPASDAERERLVRNLAEAIDDLYRHDAAARDRNRLLGLVLVQVRRAIWPGQLSERQRNKEGFRKAMRPGR